MLPHAASNNATAAAAPRLATVRALTDRIMLSPEQIRGRTRPAAKRKTDRGAITSNELRRGSDPVSITIL
jgi:hypothetical protein